MVGLTPMMEQYFNIKAKYKHCLVFFRLGDFYEMFYDDAVTASKELDLVLTAREAGQGNRAPMCGVPHHSSSTYISKLVEKGYKVAICEQVEDPKATKNIVRREVIRVVTPGTVIDNNSLDNGKNNYISAVYEDKDGLGIACADVSTGEFFAYTYDKGKDRLIDELVLFSPAEIITNENFHYSNEIQSYFAIKPYKYSEWAFNYGNAYVKLCSHFKVSNLNGFGFDKGSDKIAVAAAGALLEYLTETQKNSLLHIIVLKKYTRDSFMVIDAQSRRNLELVETMRERNATGSLLRTVDYTKTAMGARMLRKWIVHPLVDIDSIRERLDAVDEAKNDPVLCNGLQEVFKHMHDIERIMTKVVYQNANGRDLSALKLSLMQLPTIYDMVKNMESGLFTRFQTELDVLEDIYSLIDRAIIEESPVSIRDGGVIKSGFNAELDRYREVKNKGTIWLAELEARERELTGIKTLKIKHNKISGYYIELTKSNLNNAPERFARRQTLANCGRFMTEELKKIADEILLAEECINDLEFELFVQIREFISENIARIMWAANIVASIDSIVSLAIAASKNNYVKPVITNSGIINIEGGRHQVVEQFCENQFIANDTYLDESENRLSIITGPNMAGKSTFMRQTALICIMAQSGGFVPAQSAELCIVDRVFTRVGASDDLATGQSTFMMEMTEVANIIHNATKKSLLILDEIGRGTSTFDGLSIAWSILEYIAGKIGAKTLFATHYHELTELEGKVPGVVNYRVLVKESGEKIIFLRKIEKGSADKSYGIQVARLAGIPLEITSRAKNILRELDDADIAKQRNLSDSYGKAVTYSKKKLKGTSILINEPPE